MRFFNRSPTDCAFLFSAHRSWSEQHPSFSFCPSPTCYCVVLASIRVEMKEKDKKVGEGTQRRDTAHPHSSAMDSPIPWSLILIPGLPRSPHVSCFFLMAHQM